MQGTAVHEAIEFWERSGREPDENPDAMVAWYETAWHRETELLKQIEPDIDRWMVAGRSKPEKDFADRLNTGRQQVINYWNWALDDPRWHVLELVPGEYAVEVPFDINFGDVRVTGFIDQIIEWADGSITVRDLKTGSRKPSTPLQLGVYRWAVNDVIGVTPEWGDYWMAKENELSPPHDLTLFTHEFLTDRFKDMDRAERDGVYLINPGDHCRVCAVSDFCRLKGNRWREYAP